MDLGCGTGVNTEFLAKLFVGHSIVALDRSMTQLAEAETKNIPNIIYLPLPFEDYRGKAFDFILVSHVLQYIDTPVEQFIAKIYETLSPGGMALIIQQTKIGIAQLINHQQRFLENPRFQNWMIFEDYVNVVDNLKLPYQTIEINCFLGGLDFSSLSVEDKLWLEFVFCLEDFEKTTQEFKDHLIQLGQIEKMSHGNGVIILTKI